MPTRIPEPQRAAPLPDEPFRGSQAQFRTLAETIASAVFISGDGRLYYANHAAETITGYTRKELLAMNFCDLVRPDDRGMVIDLGLVRQEEIGAVSRFEVRIFTKKGEERWLDVTAATIDLDGVPARLVSAFDFTERKLAEEQIQLLAVTDPLTGLGNYRRLLDALDAEIKRSERTERPFAVLLLDLDGLKKINDRYGHLTGSRALYRLADVLRDYCRGIDTAARYGGDEFAVILPETTAAAAELVASRIHERLALDSQGPPLSVSIGVAVYPQDGETIEALLRAADREVYRMKTCGVQDICARPYDLTGQGLTKKVFPN